MDKKSKVLSLAEVISLGLDKVSSVRLTSTAPIREDVRAFLKGEGVAIILNCEDFAGYRAEDNKPGLPIGGMRQLVSQEAEEMKYKGSLGFVPKEVVSKGRVKTLSIVKTDKIKK